MADSPLGIPQASCAASLQLYARMYALSSELPWSWIVRPSLCSRDVGNTDTRVQVTSLQAQPPQAAPPSPEPTADATGSPESTGGAHAAGAAGRPASPDASLLLQAQLQALRQQMEVAAAEAERLDSARAEQARAAAAAWQEERDRLAADAADAAARAEAARGELQAVCHLYHNKYNDVIKT